jgi:hypothetical protein
MINPVYAAERANLARRTRPPRLKFGAAFALLFAASLALTGCLLLLARTGGSVSAVGSRETYAFFSEILRYLNLGLLGMSFVTHLALVFSALILASRSVAREREARTWDALLMTGVDARRLVIGKWWAVLSHVLKADGRNLWLRAAVPIWLGLTGQMSELLSTAPHPVVFVLAPAVVLLVSVGMAALAAVCGLMGSLLARDIAGALRSGLGVMALSLLLMGMVNGGITPIVMWVGGMEARWLLSALGMILFLMPLDGGVTFTMFTLTLPNLPIGLPYIALILALNVALVGGLLWAGLRWARTLATYQGAVE